MVFKIGASGTLNRARVAGKLNALALIGLVRRYLDGIKRTRMQSLDQGRFQRLLCKRHLFLEKNKG